MSDAIIDNKPPAVLCKLLFLGACCKAHHPSPRRPQNLVPTAPGTHTLLLFCSKLGLASLQGCLENPSCCLENPRAALKILAQPLVCISVTNITLKHLFKGINCLIGSLIFLHFLPLSFCLFTGEFLTPANLPCINSLPTQHSTRQW